MISLKKIYTAMLFLMSVAFIQAQDKEHPWVFGLGTNSVDVSNYSLGKFGSFIGDYFKTSDHNIMAAPSRISIGRYIAHGITTEFTATLNRIDKFPAKTDTSVNYFSYELGGRYDVNNWIGDTQWFDPYINIDFGAAGVGGDYIGTLAPGVGFNAWFNDKYGVNFNTKYKYALLENHPVVGSHFQHAISFVVRFGHKIMDQDGDGVVDAKDKCKYTSGPRANHGCPWLDSDKDGIIDKDDKCIKAKGLKENKGCPDSDKDGVFDHKDECVGVAGPKENNGCPWIDTDGDHVLDKDDKCVKIKGPESNSGCPIPLTKEAKKKLGDFAQVIEFNTGKVEFKEGVTNTLDNIAKVMQEFGGVKFVVAGHCDNTGKEAENMLLSQKRAQAVVDYLKSKGIAKWRLLAKGYGDTKPIATNKTEEGRAKNRRVELLAIKN